MLSQLYEQQAATWDPTGRRESSIYYTPAAIADIMVTSALASLEPTAGKHKDEARVLDPAVGGGVFLVSALRELVRQRWERTGKRPNTATIRKLLATQLFGLDVNESALRLSALSLYLAALELDPAPQPLTSLRFQRLIGENLMYVGGDTASGRAGSIGPNAPTKWDGKFDVVIGNPPWTSKKREKSVVSIIRNQLAPIVAERLGGSAVSASIPDDNPDLAFLWRSLRWCRPNGRIALVTHARLWLKQSPNGTEARRQILQATEWTSILNGTALRQSSVWPNVNAPFVIWFGINRPAISNGSLYHAVAVEDAAANERGRFRVDPKSSCPLRVELLVDRPWLPKALLRGTNLDASLPCLIT